MDAGEYDTNTLLINNLSSIAYRIYEPIASQSSTYTFAASDVEHALRNDGHLVYMDSARRGIWCFYLSGKDASSSSQPEHHGLTARMEVCGYPLGMVGEGNFEPTSLLKSRPPGTNLINTPSSSSSSGSAQDMTFRGAQTFNMPLAGLQGPGTMMLDGKMAPAPIQDVKGYSSVPIQEVHEFFITAVLSSLSASFCHRAGAIALNHRTVLLPPEASHHEEGDSIEARTSALATFRIYLTTTGSLIISLCVSLLQGLASSADAARANLFPSGSMVLAAPLGAFGTLQGIVDSDVHTVDNGFGQSPDTHISRVRPDPSDRFSQWRSTCSKKIQMSGTSPSLLERCSWVNIQFVPRKPYEPRVPGPTAPWPAVLCFRKPKIASALDNGFEKGPFTSASEQLDPLNSVRAWNQGIPMLEDTMARRKRERDTLASRENVEPDIRNPQYNGYSPMVLRRSSNGGAAAATAANGVMYPTPPDGIQPPGVAPPFDASVVSPGPAPPMAAPVDADAMIQNGSSGGDGFGGGWDGPDIKREPQGANFLENENMFDDLGDDMFEGNELTDADFNFFDEQPGGVEMDLSVLPELGSSMGMSATLSQPTDRASHTAIAGDNNKPAVITPQFTKPELKHARSTLTEESRHLTNMESFNLNSAVGVKRYPSPFNPDTVYKRIRASVHRPSQSRSSSKTAPSRRRSMFEKVDFDPSLSLVNKKYQENGLFNYTIPDVKGKEIKPVENKSPLTTGSSSGLAKRRRGGLRELPPSLNLLLAKISGAPENSPTRPDDALSDSEASSWDSDQDNASDTTGGGSSPAKSSVARRRPDDDTVSMAASFRDLESTSADSPSYGNIDLLRLSRPDIPELSITKYFTDPEPEPLQLSCTDEKFITVAQILTEQAASGFLRFGQQSPWPRSRESRRSLVSTMRYTIQGLRKALPRSLGGAAECQLRPFIEVQDVPLLAPPNRIQPRPAGQELVRPNIFSIPAPHIELRRYETPISVLPSALSFWESLGLVPCQGPKDVVSIGVFPALDGMRDSVAVFLERVGSKYESLKLGSFSTLPTTNSIVDGLLPVITDQEMSSMASPGHGLFRSGSALTEYMMKLAQALAASSMSDKNFVIYSVYTLDSPSSVVDYCAAFEELFEHYKRCLSDRKKEIVNDLVLQLVPLDLVTSETSLVIPSPFDYARLCIETYDRCTIFGGTMPAPAIVLEPALPRQLDFKITPTPSPNLLHENSCIHIAYAQSVDERWITAAWTDSRGSKQMTASYCLGRRTRPLTRQVVEVVNEIWETTHDLISISKVHWRVIITKCGPMDQQEVEHWITLAQNDTKATASLTLLTVDTNPSLQLIPPPLKIPLNASSVFYSTPVSTPQPSMLSPDQSGNNPPTPMGGGGAATPGAGGGGGPDGNNSSSSNNNTAATDPDPDSTLVDATDMTWGVVSSHRLNNSSSLTELNPALASGYLVKRCGPRPEDAPVAMEVNVIHTEGSNPRVYDHLLREMLINFRGLGTLARVRGVVDKEVDVRPWHVAAAEKAVRALYLMM
ncbi:mediator complex subunit 13 C-terminal-domain-containing protein [Apodospora peruviana]|uniref:Mediator of RNA polymerase II transcription subunit 13 n=1 Tax=Apodospora peruviana TaxID=516989 RepID=A0AAE0M227_9PEZI|nr:mediator complex subunit 13 C-terminal-domain-containing protein [Apodospora peruviana]